MLSIKTYSKSFSPEVADWITEYLKRNNAEIIMDNDILINYNTLIYLLHNDFINKGFIKDWDNRKTEIDVDRIEIDKKSNYLSKLALEAILERQKVITEKPFDEKKFKELTDKASEYEKSVIPLVEQLSKYNQEEKNITFLKDKMDSNSREINNHVVSSREILNKSKEIDYRNLYLQNSDVESIASIIDGPIKENNIIIARMIANIFNWQVKLTDEMTKDLDRVVSEYEENNTNYVLNIRNKRNFNYMRSVLSNNISADLHIKNELLVFHKKVAVGSLSDFSVYNNYVTKYMYDKLNRTISEEQENDFFDLEATYRSQLDSVKPKLRRQISNDESEIFFTCFDSINSMLNKFYSDDMNENNSSYDPWNTEFRLAKNEIIQYRKYEELNKKITASLQ